MLILRIYHKQSDKEIKYPEFMSEFRISVKAGDERIELPPKVLETPIIPFDQSPMFCFCCNYTYKRNSCQGKINKICTKTIMKRRWRDLNPRTGYPAYRISSADPSATWVHLHDRFYYIGWPGESQIIFGICFCSLTHRKSYTIL